MFIKLFDKHAIPIDKITCILPYELRSDKEFVKNVKRGDIAGRVFNWTNGKAAKTVILCENNGFYNVYLINMSTDLIISKIDELQNVKRKHGIDDFSKSDVSKDEKKG